jgi:hypothetical protein
MVWTGDTGFFVDTTIDGHHVAAGISGFGVDLGVRCLVPVPEPGMLVMFLGAAPGLAAVGIKRRICRPCSRRK